MIFQGTAPSDDNEVNCGAMIENNFSNSNSGENILDDGTEAEKSSNGQGSPISNHDQDLQSQDNSYEEDPRL